MSYNNTLSHKLFLKKRQQFDINWEFTMLDSIHAAVGNLDGFIQSDKRCLQTEKENFFFHQRNDSEMTTRLNSLTLTYL